MLAFSNGEVLKLLPALPARWRKGAVSGIHCRGGYQVGIEWDLTQGSGRCVIDSPRPLELLVKLPSGAVRAKLQTAAGGADLEPLNPPTPGTCRLAMASPGTVCIGFSLSAPEHGIAAAEPAFNARITNQQPQTSEIKQ
jgi:hypothetical protein